MHGFKHAIVIAALLMGSAELATAEELRDLSVEQAATAQVTTTRPSASVTSIRADRADATYAVGETVHLTLTASQDSYVTVLDVAQLTTVTDTIVIASGTSDRHVKSLAANVSTKAAQAGYRALGREGERDGEWVLVDLSDVIVHVMLPRVREFYGLEKLWDVRASARPSDG